MVFLWISFYVIFLFYLVYETIILNKRRGCIPLRITVTGIRGKTSIVRLLASVLREDGENVMAKTTGAQACLIFPDGSEKILKRRGLPSVLEQKKIIKTAYKVKADIIISEIMSIHPEPHYIESQKILRPHIVVITNIRLDHTEAMGKTKEEIAGIFYLDITKKATVFIPQKEKKSELIDCLKEKQCNLIEVKDNIYKSSRENKAELPSHVYPQDLDIIFAICNYLNIDNKIIEKGLINVSTDSGSLKIWHFQKNKKSVYLINGFGANDPESTGKTICKIKKMLPADHKNITGLLCLRKDRGDRTLQWIKFLKNNRNQIFKRLFITGGQASYAVRKIDNAYLITTKNPEKITEKIYSHLETKAILLGFGNFKRNGERLANYWEKISEK